MDDKERAELREEVLREVAEALSWPFKDQAHLVDEYRRGRWEAYQIVKRMLPPEPAELDLP